MTKSPLFIIICLTFPACLLLAVNGFTGSDEKYDPDEFGPEEPIVWNTPVRSIFDHKAHTMDAGLECDSCHDDLFPQEHVIDGSGSKMTMKMMRGGKSCGSCHDGDTAFETTSDCLSCHVVSEEPIIWDQNTKTAFNHISHVEDFSLECASCHDAIFEHKKGTTGYVEVSMAAINEGKFCGYCHNGDNAFDSATRCESCHFPPDKKIVFTQPVKSVVFDHDIHLLKGKLSCEKCHKEVFAMKKGTIEERKLSESEDPDVKRKYLVDLHTSYCGTCHDSSQAFGYLTRCTVCHIGVKGHDQLEGEKKKNNADEKSGH
ncbi:MAG: hypothetical protein KAI39_06200 [Desulfobulbaceae bacterium]|nr:hypothetical protein [Desulfobulbaceae bacterium]